VIWFVLTAGTRWEDVPEELGCSGRTAHRRLRAWEGAGIWDRLKADLLRILKKAGKLDLDTVIIEGVTVRAFGGGEATGPSPVDRGRPGTKHTVMVNKAGVPLEIRRVGAGDPLLGPLPTDAQAPQGLSDGLAADATGDQALGTGDLGGQLEGPEAGGLGEVSWAAMEHVPEPLPGGFIDDGVGLFGAGGLLTKAVEPIAVEGPDGIADRLDAASDRGGDVAWRAAVGALQEDLTPPEGEGVGGAEAGLERLPLRVGEAADEERWLHDLRSLGWRDRLAQEPH
jgi:hypothetical protein